MPTGSDAGVAMASGCREPFGVLVQKNAVQPPGTGSIQNNNMRMGMGLGADHGSGIYKPVANMSSPTPSYHPSTTATLAACGVDGPHHCVAPISAPAASHGHGINVNMQVGFGSVSDPGMKKKRGRPRKYGPDGTMALALVPSSVASQFPSSSLIPLSSSKKSRGRPLGSARKHLLHDALGAAGIGFTPHVITVKAGEDLSSKIMSFSQNGPRAVCVLSANGAISNVTLRQPATSGGTVTYEGRFEILSLSGSFMLSENGGQRSRNGGLSVSLSGPDGRVLGGGVAGLLMAASPVQVIVGSFVADGPREAKKMGNQTEPTGVGGGEGGGGGGGGGRSSPQSRVTLSESSPSGGIGSSPRKQSPGACATTTNCNVPPRGISSMPWNHH